MEPSHVSTGSLVFVPSVGYNKKSPWRVGEVTCLNRVGHGLISVRPLGCQSSATYDLRSLRAPGVKFSWTGGCRESHT
jgi:hypothetical protein